MRLVRVGLLTLSEDLTIEWADDNCPVLLGTERPLPGLALASTLVPEGDEDRRSLRSPAPFTYLAMAAASGAHLLVHVHRVPGRAGLVGTLTSVNEYLAESQSLARVQLRNTVESIIAGFAHEVRNPMAAILSLTEVAMQQHAGLDSVLVRIPGLVTRVESLLKHALAYSRPKPPKRSLHQVDFIVERATSLLRPRDTPVELSFDSADDLPPVVVDLLQAEQVLVNLLENALDAARTQVSVTAREGHTPVASVCLEVTDDGPGVPPDVAPRIFDPFFTTKAHGTGLGLAIARDLARLNGGDLRLRMGGGKTTFELYLPSTPAAVRSNW
ncbi:MAG: ATP-binding protein [Archangium sp.]